MPRRVTREQWSAARWSEGRKNHGLAHGTGIIVHTILIGLHGWICHFFTMQCLHEGEKVEATEGSARWCSIKNVHSKWKLTFFLVAAVIGEIDDDNGRRGAEKRLRNEWRYEKKKHFGAPVSWRDRDHRDYKLRCNASFHSITLHLKQEEAPARRGDVIVLGALFIKSFYWIILCEWRGAETSDFGCSTAQLSAYGRDFSGVTVHEKSGSHTINGSGRSSAMAAGGGHFSPTRLKLVRIVKPFNLKTFMLHVMAAKVDAINYFNNTGEARERERKCRDRGWIWCLIKVFFPGKTPLPEL